MELLNINSFNGTIIDIYVVGKGFRVGRYISRKVNNNHQIPEGKQQRDVCINEWVQLFQKRERDPLKKSMVTCFEDQFGSVELYKGSWETREPVADEEPGAGADKGLWVGRAGWAWSSGLSLEEVSDRAAEASTGCTGLSRSCSWQVTAKTVSATQIEVVKGNLIVASTDLRIRQSQIWIPGLLLTEPNFELF